MNTVSVGLRTRAHSLLALGSALIAFAIPSMPAQAQTGVSDDRVSLPDGPGSLDGIGDNAAIDPNMGMMSYSVGIDLPAGYPGVTPELSLGYSSGAGQSPLGIGWSMSVPFIERMTSRGLPEYIEEDRFVADGSAHLVRVSAAASEPSVYRARFEGGFIRYSWHERGAGDEGYWTAEYPDGRVAYFGADETGQTDESTRVRSPDGVFRYLLAVIVDPWGHPVRYDYRYYGSTPLVDFIGWVYDDAGTPAYTVTFDYESRNDRVSDARGGFNELLAHRMSAVHIWSGGEEIRRYALSYESDEESGGQSRLKTVRQFGHQGGEYPGAFTFTYSRSLGGVCSGEDCVDPYLVDIGNIGGNVLESGRGTLMDMNGDSLPDLVVSSPDNSPHQIYLSQMSSDGVHSLAPPFSSALAASGNFVLTDNTIQELDYDGDGFADLIDHITGQVLVNKGTGDWFGTELLSDGNAGLDTSADGDFADASTLSAADGELQNIKYFDYDADRRIDILKCASGAATSVMRNVGGGGYEQADGIQDLGASFQDDNLELADMNGDGLLDPVRLLVAGIDYKLNLGRGKWSANWTAVTNSPLTQSEDLPFTSFEDINGDGIDDIVVVDATEIRYAINRNGDVFDAVETITSAGGLAIPQRDATTSVLFADMNGNGSNDVVWVDSAGNVTYLELFPVRPNLLSRIENGIGMVTEVSYGTSVEQRARDNGAGWDNPLPTSMIVATTIDTWATSPVSTLEQHDLSTYRFHNGFYDGVEKMFRGFSRVEITAEGDEHHEATTLELTFDVGDGVDRAHMAGRQLSQVIHGPDGPLSADANTWEECDVAGVPTSGLDFPIRWTCLTHTQTTSMEARPAAEHVVVETEIEYDGYGNESLRRSLGITSIGGGACGACVAGVDFGEPCGAQCLGDETFVATVYADPVVNDNWQIRAQIERTEWAEEGGRVQSERYYYDGPDFVGLAAGLVDKGGLVRAETDTGEDGLVLQTARNKLDEHGNTVVAITPRGSVGGTGHRSTATYSADGLDVLSETLEVTGGEGLYRLERTYSYEPLFGEIETASQWYLEGEPPDTTRRWAYDEHGRPSRYADAGATLAQATEEYLYDIGSPVSRLVTRKRTDAAGAFDLEEVSCIDGLGRELMSRTKIADGRWLVSGYNVLDRRGDPVRIYQGFESSTGECDLEEEPSSLYTEHFYDAFGRENRVVHPDDAERGEASERRVVYLPSQQVLYSEDDNDPDAPGFDTPSILVRDGLERVVRIERQETAGGPRISHRVTYDDLGMISGYVDSEGNVKSQRRDLAGRVLEVNDPEAGTLRFEYDEASNVVRQTDGGGRVLEREYDDQGRKIAEWDPSDPEETLVEHVYDVDPSCPAMTCTNGAGKLVTAGFRVPRFGQVTERYGYDERSRQITTLREVGNASFLFQATYDDADRLIGEVFPDGREVRYDVDGASRIVAVPGYISSIEHSDTGLVSGFTLANGVVTRYEHDSRLMLKAIEGAVGTTKVVDLRLATDRRGNVLSVADDASPAGKPASSMALTYDGLNRLLTAELDGTAEAASETNTYVYDDLDRILSKTSSKPDSGEHVGAMQYDATQPRAVSDAGDVAFAYDSGGHATSRGNDDYVWNARGKLATVERNGREIARYGYTPFGGRFVELAGNAAKITLSPAYEIRDGIARLAISLDGARLIEEDSADVAARLFDDGNGDGEISAADAWLARSSNDAGTMLRAAARRALLEHAPRSYLHTDHLGSVVAATDEDGAVTERLSYYPYGGLRHSTAKNTELARYSGHEHNETGLLDYGERVYSPREGRWLSPDPAFTILASDALANVADLFGVYSFASNNPTSAIDEGGTLSTAAKVGIGVGAAVVVGALVTAGMVTGILPAMAVATLAAVTVVNIVGAIVGGIVSGVAEGISQYTAAKARYTANGRKVPTRAKVLAVLQVLAATVVGTASGFFSGGLSAIPSVGEAVVTVAESKGKLRQSTATGLRVGLGVVGAVLSVVNPLGLATSAASVGARAISAGAGLVVKGIIEAATWGGRFQQRLKAKFGAKKRLPENVRKQIKGFDKTKLKKVSAKASK